MIRPVRRYVEELDRTAWLVLQLTHPSRGLPDDLRARARNLAARLSVARLDLVRLLEDLTATSTETPHP